MPKDKNLNTDEVAVPLSLQRLRRELDRAAQRLADEQTRQLDRAAPAARDEIQQKHEIERQALAEKHRQQLEEHEARGDLPRSDKAVDEFNTAASSREMKDAQEDIHDQEGHDQKGHEDDDRKRREAERAKELESRYLNRDRSRDKGLDR